METIYSRTDGWPSFACWQVACCQHFRLLSYREQQFRILIGTQKDILYSFFWAFIGTGRYTKENGREERKLMSTYDSNAKALSLCTLIQCSNLLMRIQKWRGWKRSKESCFPCMRYCQGVHILTPVLPVVPTTSSPSKQAEYTVWAPLQSTWKKFVKIERFLTEIFSTWLSRKQLKSRSLRQQNCDYLQSTCPSRKNVQQNLQHFSNSKVCIGVTNQSLALLPSYFILLYLMI